MDQIRTCISSNCGCSFIVGSELLPAISLFSCGILEQASNERSDTVSAEWMSQESPSVQEELVRVLSAGRITYTVLYYVHFISFDHLLILIMNNVTKYNNQYKYEKLTCGIIVHDSPVGKLAHKGS